MCKGSQTTTQNQTYTGNPAITGSGQQALNMAQTAAQSPFAMPVAPVAGFSQDQQSAFGTVAGLQGGLNQPFQQANAYINQSAQPVSASDVANYYNPMAQNVTNQLQNIFGQQMSQTTGQLQQAAGGVGADRIAVGQGNLANQQGLAAGQTYAGLYQNALQAAQQGKQMQANAGYGLANNALAQQSGTLGQAQAQLGTGGLQQQLSQAQLNAPYQNTLAKLAYPFQTAQYLAGITGGLAPAFGGTTYGQTTAPPPSLLSGVLGLGAAGVGAAGQAGLFSGWGSGGYGGPTTQGVTDPTMMRGGGRVGYAGGGVTGQDSPFFSTESYVPDIPITPAQVQQPKLPSAQGQQQSNSGSNSGSNIGSDIANIAKVAMMFAAHGGGVRPYARGGSLNDNDTWGPQYIAKQGLDQRRDDIDNYHPYESGVPIMPGRRIVDPEGMERPVRQISAGGPVNPYAPMASYADGGDVFPPVNDLDQTASGFDARFGDLLAAQYPNAGNEVDRRSPAPGDLAFMQAGPAAELKAALAQRAAQNPGNPMHVAAVGNLAPGMAAMAQPPALPPAVNVPSMQVADAGPSNASPYAPPPPQAGPPPSSPGGGDINLDQNLPYPNATKPTAGTDWARSPWAALTAAGLRTMAGTSPFPLVNIGQGGLAGLKELEQQRTAAREEEGVNQRARQLALQAETLRKKYTEMTPYEKAETQFKGMIQTPLGMYDRVTGKFTSWEDMIKGQQGGQGSPNAPTEASAQQKAPQLPLSPYDTNAHAEVPPVNNDDFARIMQAKQNPIYKGMLDSQRKGIADPINKAAIPAREVQGDLEKMEQNYENLVKQGTLQPGKAVEGMTDLFNTIDTISRYMGTGEWNENSTAAKEALSKLSNQLGFSLARTLGAREAMQIVQQAISSVPNPTQNPQAFRRVLAEMNSKAQEQIDRQTAMDQWTAKHYGDLTGFTEWFDRTHPHAAYTKMADQAAQAPRVYYFDDPAKMAQQKDALRKQVGTAGGWIRMQGRDGQWQWKHIDGRQ